MILTTQVIVQFVNWPFKSMRAIKLLITATSLGVIEGQPVAHVISNFRFLNLFLLFFTVSAISMGISFVNLSESMNRARKGSSVSVLA